MNNKRKLLHQASYICFCFCIAFLLSMVPHTTGYAASKDTTKPTLTVTVDQTQYAKSLKVKVKATDKSGIKEVKYEKEYKKTSYFKKNGIKLVLKQNCASVTITENGVYTFYAVDKYGNTRIKRVTITNIDCMEPKLKLSSSVMNQQITVSVLASDSQSGIAKLEYLRGKITKDDEKWDSAKDITGKTSFHVASSGYVTVKATDLAGNIVVNTIKVTQELKGVWISYLEFANKLNGGYTEESFTSYVQDMFDDVVDLGMNAVIVQVRAFGDAMYPSKYFPWSYYISGTQGKDPGFDPLKIMVKEAHERGLEFHAWLNPYRVSSNYSIDALSDNNKAKIWSKSTSEAKQRNVLLYDKKLYYNPASSEVRTLIVNGVKEIVANYDVDGIHFDDYFYPTLGTNYQNVFDSKEYNTYVANCKKTGTVPLTIVNWRRNNVNTLVKRVYSTIKATNDDVRFGISPAGAINNLLSDKQYYVDFKTWMNKPGYIDYICPQIYWTFENPLYPYDTTVDDWISYRKSENVNIYIGIANYRAGSNLEEMWKESSILADMIEYARETEQVDGFMFFRYEQFYKKACLPAVEELLPVLAER